MKISRTAAALLLALSLCVPAIAFAQSFSPSFGGKILTVIPCAPGLHVTIKPAGASPVNYIYLPSTLTFLAGPPKPLSGILGTYLPTPSVCFVGKVPLFGFPMLMIGTSLGPAIGL